MSLAYMASVKNVEHGPSQLKANTVTMKPKLLDLFCGAGGASMGYSLAGFEVTGVDFVPQPNYPFEFIQYDLTNPDLEFDLDLFGFDAIHASPPCQAYSTATTKLHRFKHPRLIEPIRELLQRQEVPSVIENVTTAPLNGPVLCGSMFGLVTNDFELRRHRRFEAIGWEWPALMPVCHHGQRPRVAGVYGGGGEDRSKAKRKGSRGGYTPDVETRRLLMQMPWATQAELAEAIPPAYTKFIGNRIMDIHRVWGISKPKILQSYENDTPPESERQILRCAPPFDAQAEHEADLRYESLMADESEHGPRCNLPNDEGWRQ